ncbi:hypothetical protein WJX72_009844 [[Myrmecia] bisecta]|uniref:Uncharacterized protein n=1 Tax=[Myrmecia] bisecta TaxID=41462 RepID=A0AAW1R915_9CHLO
MAHLPPPGLLLERLVIRIDRPVFFLPELLQSAKEVKIDAGWLRPVYHHDAPSLDDLVTIKGARGEVTTTERQASSPFLDISHDGVVRFRGPISDEDIAAVCGTNARLTEVHWCDRAPRARRILEDEGFQQRQGGSLQAISGVWLAGHARWLAELLPLRYPHVRQLGIVAAFCTGASVPVGVSQCAIQAFRVDFIGLPDTVRELTISQVLSEQLVHLDVVPSSLKAFHLQLPIKWSHKDLLREMPLPSQLQLDTLELSEIPFLALRVLNVAVEEAHLSKMAGYACKLVLPKIMRQPGETCSVIFDLTQPC